MYRNFITEPDFFRHKEPKRLIGGKVERVGVENQHTVIDIPVHSLTELEPFTLYDLIIRREFPPEAKGLPLKFKCIGHIPFEAEMYTGYSREFGGKDHAEHGFEHGEHGFGHGEHGGLIGEDDVEVITEHVPAQVFDAVMWGYGNQATLNDIIIRDDAPYPFIRMYLNDKGEFVIMPTCGCGHTCRPKKLIVRREVVTLEPFKAHTLAVTKTATPYVHPQHFQHTDLWTQGNFCGCHDGYGRY